MGRDLLARILVAVGAAVVPLGRSETFVPVDTEALRPEDVELARGWAADRRLDAIVSTDGDSDRPLLADHRGTWLRGDVLGLLCARELGAACIVTPVSSTTAIERSGAFARVIRSRIGSPYVIAAMAEAARDGAGPVCGFEANGGFLLESPIRRDGRVLAALPTRDAVLPILAVLAAARSRPVARQRDALPRRVTWSDRLKDFPTADSRAVMAYLTKGGPAERLARVALHFWPLAGAPSKTDDTDGVRMTFANGAIIHLRPSGNAPELRCYTEAADEETARTLNAAALSLVREALVPAARRAGKAR